MANDDTNQQKEADYSTFVDRGTQAVLQEAIQKVVETFSHSEDLEDILRYLEDLREDLRNHEERVKEIQQREKQILEKSKATETAISNLLQRIQSMEVRVDQAGEKIDMASRIVEKFAIELVRLSTFFEQPPFKRMFSRLQPLQKHSSQEDRVEEEESGQQQATGE